VETQRAVVGPYRILGRLGAGGMGEVFLAEDSRLRRRVALKAVTASHAANREARLRLLREARAAAGLNHPNIAAIYDVLETDADSGMYIVMEYVEGTSLDEMVRTGPLPVRRVVQIGLELADALATAHAQGIVHRDLKPSNVRLTTAGHVKVLDFGLARTLDDVRVRADSDQDTATLTEANQLVGTPAYMAPEQLRGGRGDQKSDIYGLGVVLYELLTGQRPFDGATTLDLAVQAITKGVPDVRTGRPDTPADLAAVIARATALEPHDRLTSAEELHSLLQDVYSEQPTPSPSSPLPPVRLPSPAPTVLASAPLPAPPKPAWHGLQSRPVLVLAAVLALCAVGAVAWRFRPASRLGPETRAASVVAVLPVAAPTGTPELESTAAGVGEVIAANLGAVPGLQVIPRRETTASLGERRNVGRVLQDLAPNYVVNAAVDGTPTRYRLEVKLLDAAGNMSWSRIYEGRTDDPFSLPAQVSEDVGRAMADLGAVSRQAIDAVSKKFQKPPTTQPEAWSYYTDALRFLDRPDIQGNLTRATTLLEEAVKKDPRFALGWAALATACSAQYDETKEQRWITRVQEANLEALRLDPDRAETRLALAQMYENTGAYDQAVEEYQRAMALSPSSDLPLRLLGGLCIDAGRLKEAVTVLQQAVDLRPGYWRNWSFLGQAYYQAGRPQDAIKAYYRLLALQPDNTRGHSSLGAVLQEIGRNEEAREHYRRAVDIDNTPSAWSNLGTLEFFDGRHVDAARAYEKAIALDKTEATYHRNLGDARLALGRRAEAARAYGEALELVEQQLATNPRDPEVISLRPLLEAKLGRLADARQHAVTAYALLPENKEVNYHLCVVAALDGRLDDAAALLGRALERGYSVRTATLDPDLAKLRQVPGVRERLAAAGSPR
jgi:serine/threonine-protein kinase